MMAMTIREHVITVEQRFGLHGLKHRGITNTASNRADKKDAAGHATPERPTARPQSAPRPAPDTTPVARRKGRNFPGNFPAR